MIRKMIRIGFKLAAFPKHEIEKEIRKLHGSKKARIIAGKVASVALKEGRKVEAIVMNKLKSELNMLDKSAKKQRKKSKKRRR